jgi:hypothetical protein
MSPTLSVPLAAAWPEGLRMKGVATATVEVVF